MAKSILVEEFHVTFFMQAALQAVNSRAVIRTLRSKAFKKRLRDALGTVVRRYPTLQPVRIKLTC